MHVIEKHMVAAVEYKPTPPKQKTGKYFQKDIAFLGFDISVREIRPSK